MGQIRILLSLSPILMLSDPTLRSGLGLNRHLSIRSEPLSRLLKGGIILLFLWIHKREKGLPVYLPRFQLFFPHSRFLPQILCYQESSAVIYRSLVVASQLLSGQPWSLLLVSFTYLMPENFFLTSKYGTLFCCITKMLGSPIYLLLIKILSY